MIDRQDLLNTKHIAGRLSVGWFTVVALTVASVSAEEVRFSRDIRPLLSDRCFHCHGPNEADRQADLRLDRAEGEDGAHALALKPGSPEKSELWMRITSDDPDVVMPPPSQSKPPLTSEEKALIRQWIEQGARYEKFWAFVPPVSPTMPPDIPGAPIDRLVRQRLREEGLAPAPAPTSAR